MQRTPSRNLEKTKTTLTWKRNSTPNTQKLHTIRTQRTKELNGKPKEKGGRGKPLSEELGKISTFGLLIHLFVPEAAHSHVSNPHHALPCFQVQRPHTVTRPKGSICTLIGATGILRNKHRIASG